MTNQEEADNLDNDPDVNEAMAGLDEALHNVLEGKSEDDIKEILFLFYTGLARRGD